ncbi:YciI family protein [Chelativorans sp. J32]|uniref:YciI family protein n=1 Tax=Chelativorans sp. J32 TaxID=935840 RepID=UPI00048485FD|nr:YciI family protein [Chelativorans sp. J32]
MRYVCLVYVDQTALRALPKEEMDRLVQDSIAYDGLLAQQGNLVVAHALEAPSRATNLVTRGGKVVTVDGPFSEAKEQLVGFLLVEAKDRDDAVAMASKVPIGRYGRIEIRMAGKPGEQ